MIRSREPYKEEFGNTKLGDKVFYKREKQKMWRGSAVVTRRDGKNVIVKYGGILREMARVHVTRIKSGKKGEEDQESEATERSDEEELGKL